MFCKKYFEKYFKLQKVFVDQFRQQMLLNVSVYIFWRYMQNTALEYFKLQKVFVDWFRRQMLLKVSFFYIIGRYQLSFINILNIMYKYKEKFKKLLSVFVSKGSREVYSTFVG